MTTKKTTTKSANITEKEPQKSSIWRTLFGWVPAVLNFGAAVLNAAGKIALVGFFTRYWLLLAVLVAFVALLFSGWIVDKVGTMIWLPAVGLGGWAFVLAVINIFHRKTIDKDIDTGRFSKDWNEVGPEIRLKLTVATMLVLFLGYCIIANGLASR